MTYLDDKTKEVRPKGIHPETAVRISKLSSAFFARMSRLKQEIQASGRNVIDLGIGSPDQPPSDHVRRALFEAAQKPEGFGYPTSEGSPRLRNVVAQWYLKRFGVELDPDKEVLILMGSQDGLGHLAMAFLNPGDTALIPNPCYPIYRASIYLAEGEIYEVPLVRENNFLPDLSAIPSEIAAKAKLMLLNYPNNPVTAVADTDFFRKVVAFALTNNIIIAHDCAYSEIAFDGFMPPSFLSVPGAREVGIEFNSVSKSFNMAGCRLGFAVGHAGVIEALSRIKANIDYGVFLPVQEAAAAALSGPQDLLINNRETYRRRRDLFIAGLARLGWEIPKSRATMFIWAPLPPGYTDSMQFAEDLIKATGVLVIPGVGFGSYGEGYVRIALVQEDHVLEEALERMTGFFKG